MMIAALRQFHGRRAAARGRRGFTLIEALATIAVLAIVIPVLVGGFILAGDIAGLTQQNSDATLLAQSIMDQMIANGDWQNGGSSTEQIGPNFYTWSASSDAWDNEADVQQFTITVEWQHKSTHRQIALTTVVYQSGTTVQGTSGPGLLGGGLP